MSTFSQFHVWATGETITAALLNGEIASIVTAGNNIDNNNIGAAGIFASQVIPTNGTQSTFGGTTPYSMPPGLNVATNADGNVPLTITGNSSSQSADYLDITKVGSAAGGIFNVGLSGNVTQAGATILATPGGTLTTQVGITNDNNGGTVGMALNVPGSSTNGFQLNVAGTTRGKLSSAGVLSAAPTPVGGSATLGPVAPVYTATGTATGATLHACQGSILINAGASVTVTLTNNAVFTGVTTYVVTACTIDAGGVGVIPASVGIHSATQFILTNTTGTNNTYTWFAIGT